MSMRPSRGARSAFTLIELVLGTAIMAMILAAAYLCLSAGLSSRALIESREEILQNARVAMAKISADLRSACPLSKDLEFVGMHRLVGETRADNLDFATRNYSPRRPREADFCEISYFLEKDIESGSFTLWRRRDPTPDEEPLSGGSREEIARRLQGLGFEYYDGFEWYEEWGDPDGRQRGSLIERFNVSGMPEAVRITLWFDSSIEAGGASRRQNESAEPPLVFQTVARLNLAGAARAGASSASSVNPGSPSGQPASMPPSGGNR